jgi:hypothetical protein
MTYTSPKNNTYKEAVKTECINYLHSLSCTQYFSGAIFDKFYSKLVKMGMRSISSLSTSIADEILHTSKPAPPLEDEI